jgi:hypothetical protein
LPAAALLALAAAVPSAGPAAAAPAPFTVCASDAMFQVRSVDIEPQPLVPGKKVTVKASGTLQEQLTGGSYSADLRYMGVSIQQLSGPVGQLITLPAQPGPATMGATVKVPKQTPQGSYELRFSAVDQNGSTLACLSVPFRVG